MKKRNTAIQTPGTFITLILFMLLCAPLNAEVNSVAVTSMTPPNPAPGQNVDVVVYWCVNAWEESHLMVAVSDTSTFRDNNTAGQIFLVSDVGINVQTGSVNGGYDHGDNPAVPTCQSITWTITIPSTLNEGQTYYVLAGGRAYYTNPEGTNLVSQNFLSFTTPPPATGMSITKTAEVTPVRPGDYVLYTIDYNYANANNVSITDVVPANCTLISQSFGGINGGTTAGSGLTWNFADTVARVRGKVWFIVQVDAGAPYSTPISSVANWSLIDPATLLPVTGASNDAVVMTATQYPVLKTQIHADPTNALIGDTVTYVLDFHSGGIGFASYNTFDTSLSGFTAVSNGLSNPGTWTWTADTEGGHITTPEQGISPVPQYPHLLKNDTIPFCFGEITADLQILGSTDKFDTMITFRDGGVPDASVAYGVGISEDDTPGDIYLQKSQPAYVNLIGVQGTDPLLGTWYTVKILVTDEGNGSVRIRAKYWKRGDPEYPTWMINYPDSTGIIPPCGYVGFQSSPQNGCKFDNLKIIKTNPTNPVVVDTIPTIITYIDGSGADTTHGPSNHIGSTVSWNINTSFTDQAYSLTWWGTANNCDALNGGPGYNIFTVYTMDNPPVDSNSTTLNVPLCPQTPTITTTWTYTPTSTPSRTPTSSYTFTPTSTFTMTATPSLTRTSTPSRTVTLTPVYYPTLEMTKVSDINPAQLGGTVVYTINYRNSGIIAANNVLLTDAISTNLTYVPGSATGGGIHNGINPGGMVSWNIASIAPGGTGSVSFSAIVGAGIAKGTIIQNQAIAVCTPQQVAANSNMHTLNLDIPDLDLTEVATVPNPASDNAEIIFHLTVAARVRIKFYTVSGELIRTMENDEVVSNLLHGQTVIRGTRNKNDINGNNSVHWNCMNGGGKAVASGIYFYRVEAESNAEETDSFLSKLAVLK